MKVLLCSLFPTLTLGTSSCSFVCFYNFSVLDDRCKFDHQKQRYEHIGTNDMSIPTMIIHHLDARNDCIMSSQQIAPAISSRPGNWFLMSRQLLFFLHDGTDQLNPMGRKGILDCYVLQIQNTKRVDLFSCGSSGRDSISIFRQYGWRVAQLACCGRF